MLLLSAQCCTSGVSPIKTLWKCVLFFHSFTNEKIKLKELKTTYPSSHPAYKPRLSPEQGLSTGRILLLLPTAQLIPPETFAVGTTGGWGFWWPLGRGCWTSSHVLDGGPQQLPQMSILLKLRNWPRVSRVIQQNFLRWNVASVAEGLSVYFILNNLNNYIYPVAILLDNMGVTCYTIASSPT